MSSTTSCAFLADGRTVVVELTGCALVVELDRGPQDLSPVAAAVYAAGVEALVGRGGAPVADAVEVGRVHVTGEPDGCRTWVVDVAAGSSLPVPVDALVALAAAGIGHWLSDGIDDEDRRGRGPLG